MGQTTDIRDRLVTILDTITAITGTALTIAPRIPTGIADFEGYIVYPYPRSSTITKNAPDNFSRTQLWAIDLLTPTLGLGLKSFVEDNLYTYADNILDTLKEYPRLEHVTTRAPLTGVRSATITGDAFTMPIQWQDVYKHKWSVQLTVVQTILREC